MQRMLLARECGDDGCGLEDISLERWSALRPDESREIVALFSEALMFVDIETPNASLLLCGGEASSTREGENSGSVGIFPTVAATEKAVKEPVAFTSDDKDAKHVVTCGKWMPDDPGLFVTADINNQVSVWDTSCFKVAVKMSLETELDNPNLVSEVSAIDMSFAPGARTELVATCRANSNDVTLVDLGTGSSTHRLTGHTDRVIDVKWSPTNPHMLASCGQDGIARVFDVRRAGNLACLVTFDEYKKLPEQPWECPPGGAHETQPHRPAKRNKTSRRAPNRKQTSRTPEHGFRGLGLGCAWEESSAPQERRRRRRAEASRKVSSRGTAMMTRIRFCPDGRTLVSCSTDYRARFWDIHTGSLISSQTQEYPATGAKMHVEVARDNYHLFVSVDGDLRTREIESGRELSNRQGHMQYMEDMAIHPLVEELYTVSGSQLICWSPLNSEAASGKRPAQQLPY